MKFLLAGAIAAVAMICFAETNDIAQTQCSTNRWYQLIAERAQKDSISMAEAAKLIIAENKVGNLNSVQHQPKAVTQAKNAKCNLPWRNVSMVILFGMVGCGFWAKKGKRWAWVLCCFLGVVVILLFCYSIWTESRDQFSEANRRMDESFKKMVP